MRTALRTSIATAALAGALLAPAAGAAFAATGPQAATSTEAAASKAKRVTLSKSLVADMINSATEPPSVKVFAVLPDGTVHPKAIASLDRKHTKVSVQGTTFTLTKADSAEPVLTVFVATPEGGTTTSFPLPKGKATEPASCVSAVKTVRLGEYLSADLTMSPKGPKAVVRTLEGQPNSRTLDRTHPGRSTDALRIENPNGAKPVFRWEYQVGDATKTASFPALPKGCKLDYKITEQGAKPAPKPKPKPKPGAQTVIVPKGPVAAGAELPVETVADTDNTTTVAAGAGLIAVFGALGASVFLRRSRAQG